MAFLSRNFKLWLHSLLATIIGGAANSLSVMLVDPTDFNFVTHSGLIKLGKVALAGAIIALVGFLKTKPIPDEETP